MRNNIEELTIADLKALYFFSKERMEKYHTHTPQFDYWIDVYQESFKELNKRVENIFGKPLEGQG